MDGESINPYSLLQTIMLVYLSFLSINFSSVEYLTPPCPQHDLLCILYESSSDSQIIDMLGSFGVFKNYVLLCWWLVAYLKVICSAELLQNKGRSWKLLVWMSSSNNSYAYVFPI